MDRIEQLQRATGLPFTSRYTDEDSDGTEFEVVEFGDPLEGRAFVLRADGTCEEIDR